MELENKQEAIQKLEKLRKKAGEDKKKKLLYYIFQTICYI